LTASVSRNECQVPLVQKSSRSSINSVVIHGKLRLSVLPPVACAGTESLRCNPKCPLESLGTLGGAFRKLHIAPDSSNDGIELQCPRRHLETRRNCDTPTTNDPSGTISRQQRTRNRHRHKVHRLSCSKPSRSSVMAHTLWSYIAHSVAQQHRCTLGLLLV
jgi:hypothetical protein